MPIPENLDELTNLFEKLGAESPELWAGSQIREGIPQLLRFMFIKQSWGQIVDENDTSWIEREIEYAEKDNSAPYSGLGTTLKECLEKGVKPSDLNEIARCLQVQMLFNIGYLLDGPAYTMDEKLDDVDWGLFQLDEKGNPIGPQIGGIHESVLEFDPTGREMCPKSV